MANHKVERTGSYLAVDESGGSHTISIYTTFTEYKPISGPVQWLPGTKSHKMPNGNHVNVNTDGSLEEVATGRAMKALEGNRLT